MLARVAALLAAVLLATCQLPSFAYGKPSGSGRVPLSCSVIMYSSYDYTSDKCINAVINARNNCGGNRINFIPTLFWWEADADKLTPPKIEKFCVDSGAWCQEVNTNSIGAFRWGMHRCLKKAISLGFTEIDIAPHLDDARYLHWRAQLGFSPNQKYGRYTYVEAVLQPVADAVHAVLAPNIRINFATVGEMSGTIFRNAKDWIPVLKKLKAMVGKKTKAALAQRNVKVGVSTNWDKLCGCYNLGVIDPVKFFQSFKKAYKNLERKGLWNSRDVQALFRTFDFIGASYYPYNVAAMTPAAFETSAQLFSDELALFGVDLRAFIASGKQLRFHEYGLGGGISGHTVAASKLGDILKYPFFGVGGTYVKKNDPFQLWRPQSANSAPRLLVRKFYRETLKWLSKGGGPKFKISAVYLWNSGSWDITGVSPDSYSNQGSWKDPFTQAMIKAYNDKGIVPK